VGCGCSLVCNIWMFRGLLWVIVDKFVLCLMIFLCCVWGVGVRWVAFLVVCFIRVLLLLVEAGGYVALAFGVAGFQRGVWVW